MTNKKKQIKEILVKRSLNIRYYTYTAHLSAKTGKVLRITAGCRTWKTFQAARIHYNGDYGSLHWRFYEDYNYGDPKRREAERIEADSLLSRLFNDVIVVQSRLRAKMKRTNKRRVSKVKKR